MEVKPITSRSEDIEKDLCSFTAFRQHGRYHKGIYLVYGGDEEEFNAYRRTVAELGNRELTCGSRRRPDRQYNDRIDLGFLDLCWHQRAGQQAGFVPIND